MTHLNLKEEKKLWRSGYRIVIGLDEAGRGPLAGSVVAAAVTIQLNNLTDEQVNSFNGLKDSKKLSFQKREHFYGLLTEHPLIEWGIGRVGERVIDRINILEATKLAMKRAVKNLTKKLYPVKCRFAATQPFLKRTGLFNRVKNLGTEELKGKMFLLIDGNFGIPFKMPQRTIIKGDEIVFSITLASIIAKVFRDRAMLRCHKKYPRYGFDKHKGYPTRLHSEMLKKYGPCEIHRKTFGPVQKLLNC